MKRPSLSSREAQIRQVRRDILRLHRLVERARRHPFKDTMIRIGKANMIALCALMLAIIGPLLIWPTLPLVPQIGWMLAGLLIMLANLVWMSRVAEEEARLRPLRRYEEALEFLTATHDLRAIGPLAEAYWLRNIPSSVAGALTRLLRVQNQMQVSVALDAKQSRCLYRILSLPRPDEADLQIAILDFAETFGDVRALPFVRALAEEETRLPRLQAAALRCHAALQAEQAHAAGRNTLLRGTHAPPSHPEQLLHPSQSSPETQPEQLLRATTHIPPQA